MYAFMPELMEGRCTNDDGIGGEHIYMPRFNHRDGRKRDYLRGFGMQFWGCGAQDLFRGPRRCRASARISSADPKQYPALVALHPYGEALGRAENRIVIEDATWISTECPDSGSNIK